MQENTLPIGQDSSVDKIETVLQNISRNIVTFVFGLLPILFIPVTYIGFDYVKVVIVVAGILAAIIFFSLSVLRSGRLSVSAPTAILGLWLVALAGTVSALLSGNIRASYIGDDLSVHTALFLVLLALIPTVMVVIGQHKSSIMRMYMLLTISGLLLGLFHIARVIFGVGFLKLHVFTSLAVSPLGGWNDVALFFGLSILLSLVALEQLPLTKWGRGLFSSVVVFALIMLSIVNFFAVWIVLALVSLMVLMYTLSKDRFIEKTLTLEGKKASVSIQSVLLSVVVFFVSVVFIIGGGSLGGFVSKYSHINYVEVRPSFGATMQIARSVYAHDAFIGIGPNKFVNAWRLYKDPSINQTIFWATDFNSGNGYITTLFVTTGILGVIALLCFFGLFLFAGFKMLFRSSPVDQFWYFIGSSSFVASVYLWGMSCIYVPGATILLLAAAFTGITFTAYAALLSPRSFAFSLNTNRRAGFVLVGVVMIIIVASTTGLYYIGQHYSSVYTFGNAVYGLQNGEDIHTAEQQIADAYSTSGDEAYVAQLAAYQLAKINALAQVQKPDQNQQQELQSSLQNGIQASQLALAEDPTDPIAWSTLGSIYSVLAGANVDSAKDKAQEAFVKAQTYDPHNPLYILLQAQLSSRTGDLAAARDKANAAIALKPNYTDALFFLAQIDIAEGKTADAIATTKTMVSLEPTNPARYYQLGFLEASNNDLDSAIAAFNQAIAIDTNYANARYFLGLALAQKGDTQGALEQLQKVLSLNPGNADVTALIEQVQSGKPIQFTPQNTKAQVTEPDKVTQQNDTVTTTEAPDTSLVSPVNPVSNSKTSSSTSSSSSEKSSSTASEKQP